MCSGRSAVDAGRRGFRHFPRAFCTAFHWQFLDGVTRGHWKSGKPRAAPIRSELTRSDARLPLEWQRNWDSSDDFVRGAPGRHTSVVARRLITDQGVTSCVTFHRLYDYAMWVRTLATAVIVGVEMTFK
jgi:hypothetical protein